MNNENNSFEPEIVAFCCRHCAYAAADLAGTMRLEYPTFVKVIELPCTGRLDVLHVLRAFEDGVDGALVAGCLEGDCHYLEGNLNAKRRVDRVRSLLEQIGLEPERARMFNLSSAMGGAFAEAATDMSARVKALGPNPLRKPEDEK